MRRVLLMAIASIFIPACAYAQANEGLACYQNLATPEYPKAALRSHVDGSVWTTTHVSPQGTIDKIETQVVSAWADGPKLLAPPVEKAIRAAKIKPDCAGKLVLVVFRYQLYGEAIPNPTVKSTPEPPHMLFIESQPATMTETSTNKAPATTR